MVKYLELAGGDENNPRNAWDAEIQNLIRSADEDTIVQFHGYWLLTDQIQNLGKSKRWELNVATFIVRAPTNGTACFLFRNMDEFTLTALSSTTIKYEHNVTSNPATGLIYFIDVTHGYVNNIKITGLENINGIVMEARTKQCSYVVNGCRLSYKNESYRTSHHVAIRIKSKLVFGNGTSNTHDSVKSGVAPYSDMYAYIRDSYVLRNTVDGGYYGVDMSGTWNCQVAYNKVMNNERGMSFQDSCSEIRVEYNEIENNRSAGIHFAYGSHNCVAQYNVVHGSSSNGEALMQAYVWTKDNLFRRNALSSTNTPTYAFQGSVGGTLSIEDCTADMEGGVSRALIADEQSWDPSLKQVWHSRMNAESTNEGLEISNHIRNIRNTVTIKNSTLFSRRNGTPAAVVSNVKGAGNNGPILQLQNTQFSVPGKSDVLLVGDKPSVQGDASSYFSDEHIVKYEVGERRGDRYISDDKHLQDDYGFIPDTGGGGGSSPAPAPAPSPAPSGPVPEAGTLKEGTKTKQLVVFATRPETGTNQWGDWLAFFEMENGEVTTWPEQVDIPRWSGPRTFPCVILPVNGSIQSPLPNLMRTVITLDGQGYLATHPTIKGVQWYARNRFAEVANARVTREKTATGEVPVRIEESPPNYNGTVGQACPSGYATFVWVRQVGSTLTCQYVAVRNAVPVESPDNDAWRDSITFSSAKGFPAIVWPGDKLPADGNFRNLRRAYITMPPEFSGNTGVMSVPTSAISNSAVSKLVLGTGAEGELPESQVTQWYGDNAPLTPGNSSGGSGGTTNSGNSGVRTSSQTIIDAAIRGSQRGHEISYPGWTIPQGVYSNTRTSGAQVRGAAVTIGGTLKLGDLRGSKLWDTGFDGAFVASGHSNDPTWWLRNNSSATNSIAYTLQDWVCLLPGANGASTWVELRNCRLYVLEKGSNRWKLAFDNRAPVSWAANQGPSMNPGNSDERAAVGGRTDLQHSSSGTSSRILLPNTNQRNAHFGPGDFRTDNLADKSINLNNVHAVCSTIEARLADGYSDRVVGIQMGIDPKWGSTPSGWFPGLYVSRLMKLTPNWTLYSMFNSSEALDSERGAITITPAFFRSTTFPV